MYHMYVHVQLNDIYLTQNYSILGCTAHQNSTHELSAQEPRTELPTLPPHDAGGTVPNSKHASRGSICHTRRKALTLTPHPHLNSSSPTAADEEAAIEAASLSNS